MGGCSWAHLTVAAVRCQFPEAVKNELVPAQLGLYAHAGVLDHQVVGDGLVRPGALLLVLESAGLR